MNSKINKSIKLPALEEVIEGNYLRVNPNTSIVDAIALMSQARGQSVPLQSTKSFPNLNTAAPKSSSYVVAVEGRQLVGVFTETDVVKLIASIHALQKINPQVKIIATSGIFSKERLALIAAAGIKEFLSKPYTITELLNILHKVLVER